MDPKKQNLTPELKQIYDRVMNTQVKKPEPAAPVAAPTTTTAPNAAPQTPVAAANPNPTPTTAPQQPQPGGNVGNNAFLSSTPPRPLTGDKTFVFTGNKMTTAQGTTEVHAPGTVAKKKISPPILIAGIVVGVVVWALIWAKVFGLF